MNGQVRLLSVLASDPGEFDRQAGAMAAAGWVPIIESFRVSPGTQSYSPRVVMLFRFTGDASAVDNGGGLT